MMRVLFAHDHVFKIDHSGWVYSEGKITNETFSRYEVLASEVIVVSRMAWVASPDGLSRIDKTGVKFDPLFGNKFSNIFSLNLIKNLGLVSKNYNKCEALILRLPSFTSFLFLPFLLFGKKKYFVELVGFPLEAIQTSGGGIARQVIAHIGHSLTRHLVKNSTGTIYVTKDALQKQFPTRGFSSYASNVELPSSSMKGSMLDHKAPKSVIQIGLIGSFTTPYKGIATAIEALELVRRSFPRCCLRILGSGDKEPYMTLAKKLRCDDFIFFDGSKSGGSDVYAWLDELDIYIQPSLTEGLPRSLLEAMSRGLPCIASDAGGMPETLPAEWIFPAGAAHELASRLKTFVSDPELRTTCGAQNLGAAASYASDILKVRRRDFWTKAADEIFKNNNL